MCTYKPTSVSDNSTSLEVSRPKSPRYSGCKGQDDSYFAEVPLFGSKARFRVVSQTSGIKTFRTQDQSWNTTEITCDSVKVVDPDRTKMDRDFGMVAGDHVSSLTFARNTVARNYGNRISSFPCHPRRKTNISCGDSISRAILGYIQSSY